MTPTLTRILTEAQRAGMTKADIARCCGVDWDTVNRWSNGKRQPKLADLEPLIQALKLRLARK